MIDALVYERNKAFGFQEYLFNLLNYFYAHRDSIFFERIILICDEKQIDDFAQFENKFDIIGYKVSNLFLRFVIQTKVPFDLKLKKKDVVLNLCNYSGLFKRAKSVLVIHDLLYLRKDLLQSRLMRLQRKFYVPRSISLADLVIAISDFTKNDILDNFKKKSDVPIIKIYNYFNFDKFGVDISDYEKRNTDSYLLSVSSSAFHKNTITVLMAFEKFCQYNEDKKMYFVGLISEPSALEYYNQLAPEVKERIKIFSYISNTELGMLYNECDAYISASLFEGLGMPIIEAMFFNAQLIISDLKVTREITANKAFFFNPICYEELFEIMLNIKKAKTDTRSYVLDKFSSDETSKKYVEKINEI